MERLQKVLAQAGIASRRKCEDIIQEGRVQVDGKVVTELGFKVNAQVQSISVDDVPIQMERKIALVLNKPTSRITSVTDPEGRKTVMDLIKDVAERVYPVGRLDYDTSGLLLMTNDGELTNRLLHPSREFDKVYRVTVVGMIEKDALKHLRTGIVLEDGKTAPAHVTVLRQHPKESVVDLTIHEGRNRQVRRMFEALDLPVKRLKRIAFGPLELGTLATGEWRMLNQDEWQSVYMHAGLNAPPYPVQPVQKDQGKNAKPSLPHQRPARKRHTHS